MLAGYMNTSNPLFWSLGHWGVQEDGGTRVTPMPLMSPTLIVTPGDRTPESLETLAEAALRNGEAVRMQHEVQEEADREGDSEAFQT